MTYGDKKKNNKKYFYINKTSTLSTLCLRYNKEAEMEVAFATNKLSMFFYTLLIPKLLKVLLRACYI